MNEPKLRFKTDNGEKFPNLEVKRLGDITVPYNVRNKNILPLEIYSVNNIVGFVPQSEQFEDAGYLRNTDTSIYMIVPPKHFAYNPARIDIGSIGYQYLDHDVQVSSLYEVFKTSDSVNDEFLWMWFHTSYFNHTVKRLQEGGVRLYFYYDKMQETKIGLPSLAEQQKIAYLFTELDNLIQSAENELEGYRELKQGMLQKMFPKKGEKVPEIRFPEFTDDWEQHKLSELATMHARIGWQNLRTSEFLDTGDYMLITGTDFEDGKVNYSTCHYVEKERYDQDKNIQIKNGSILITKDGTLGKVAYVEGLNMPATLNAGVFNIEVRNENETDGKYLFQFLRGPFLMDYVAKKVAGSTIKHLNQNILVDFPISMPSKEEQKKIGEYFQNLDNLITSQKQELEGYKELKKGLLQQMFC